MAHQQNSRRDRHLKSFIEDVEELEEPEKECLGEPEVEQPGEEQSGYQQDPRRSDYYRPQRSTIVDVEEYEELRTEDFGPPVVEEPGDEKSDRAKDNQGNKMDEWEKEQHAEGVSHYPGQHDNNRRYTDPGSFGTNMMGQQFKDPGYPKAFSPYQNYANPPCFLHDRSHTMPIFPLGYNWNSTSAAQPVNHGHPDYSFPGGANVYNLQGSAASPAYPRTSQGAGGWNNPPMYSPRDTTQNASTHRHQSRLPRHSTEKKYSKSNAKPKCIENGCSSSRSDPSNKRPGRHSRGKHHSHSAKH